MILGIDIGTSVTKAALFQHDGTSSHHASRPSSLTRLGDGFVEQDLEEVIAAVGEVAREALAGLPGAAADRSGADAAVEAVAITAQGDGLWLRDADGRAVRPPISWMDARAAGIVSDWTAAGITEEVYRLTGSGIFPGSHAGLLAWLDRHEPDSLDRSAVAGYCGDAILQRLTGQIAVDASDASLPFLDVRTRTYVGEALELCGIRHRLELLAAPAAPGTILALDAAGAALIGLPVGTPVTSGPYDLQACGLGAGATRAGEGTVVIGTTLATQVLTRDAAVPPHSEPAGMWLCTPDPELFLRVMPSMVGTASIDWLLDLFGLDTSALSELLSGSAPDAGGVRALSFLAPSGERAPFVDPAARGQLTGLQLGTGRPELVRALCESIAYAARNCFEELGLDGDLSATGGGTRSAALTQLFADVMGRPIAIPIEREVGARGAALVAWSALGRPVDEELWRSRRRIVEPAPGGGYDRGYERYLADLAEARARWSIS